MNWGETAFDRLLSAAQDLVDSIDEGDNGWEETQDLRTEVGRAQDTRRIRQSNLDYEASKQ